jgi:hypothetical protein
MKPEKSSPHHAQRLKTAPFPASEANGAVRAGVAAAGVDAATRSALPVLVALLALGLTGAAGV